MDNSDGTPNLFGFGLPRGGVRMDRKGYILGGNARYLPHSSLRLKNLANRSSKGREYSSSQPLDGSIGGAEPYLPKASPIYDSPRG